MSDFFIGLSSGLSSGATYAIIALGYTMVYGIAKMLNFAHGDVIMLSGFVMYELAITGKGLLEKPLAYALAAETENRFLWFLLLFAIVAISMLISLAIGVLIERLAYRPLRGASPLAVLITAIGVSYLLQSVAQIRYGTNGAMLDHMKISGSPADNSLISYHTIVTVAVSLVVMVALTLFVKYSKTGRAMVAVSEDRGAAQLMGINTNRIIAVTFAIGSALAAVAGFFMMTKGDTIVPTLGAMPGIKAFTAAVIGGIGSMPGAMLGGILLGLIEGVCNSFPTVSPFATAIEFAVLIAILMVKPAGLLGKARKEKV